MRRQHRLATRIAAPIAALFLSCAGPAMANNLVITNVSLENVVSGTADIEFDLSWDDAWRASWTEDGGATYITNWDAAWVFAKYRTSGGPWHHAILATNGHTATGGTTIEVGATEGMNAGAFVFRSGEGSGTLTCQDMALKWDYLSNGLGGTNAVDISVHAIEMVFVPEGAFKLGSGGTESAAFYQYPNTTVPYPVTNELAITVGTETGNLYHTSPTLGILSNAFPKGYMAIYCMKHEITQGQYAEFLNHLTAGHATDRYQNMPGSWKYEIYESGGTYTSAAPDRACNYMNWADVGTYLDWAALRPMTDLEFEKVCRGPIDPIPNEFAWGDTGYTTITGFSGTDGSGTETALPSNANSLVNAAMGGPVRAGIFATAGSTRHDAGAGYYGVMEMSGNLYEIIISADSTDARKFTGTHGDGDVSFPPLWWPDMVGSANGSGSRGGEHGGALDRTRTSDRNQASSPMNARVDAFGGRGVRTAP